jgi:putative transposase
VNGRKRHILVDTMGLLLRVVVHAADIQDRDGAKRLLALAERDRLVARLERIWADGGYAGRLVDWVRKHYGWRLEVVRRTDGEPGFEVLPHRWIVERTFGWFGRYRRRRRSLHLRRHDSHLAPPLSPERLISTGL